MQSNGDAIASQTEPNPQPLSGVLLFVVNVSWFFLSHRLPLALEAKRRGMQVHLATRVTSESDRARIAAAGIRLYELQVVRARLSLIADAILFWKLVRLYRRVRPDLVHHVTMKPVVFGGIACRFAPVRAVVSAITGLGYAFVAQGAWAALRRRLLKFLLRVALGGRNSCVIFQNPDDAAAMVDAAVVERGRAVVIAGSGVDLARYSPRPEPASNPVRVLLASRMLAEKGVEIFVQAAGILRAERVPAEYLLAGLPDPDNPGSIPEATLRRWDERREVRWLGHSEDMPALLESVHVVCLPSYYGEGVPKVLIEAAAAARPIVATDTPGCREIVRDGVNGILVPPRDAVALAGAVRRLIADPALRASFGVAGRRLAESQFSLHQVVNRTMHVYATLLAHKAHDAE